MTGATQVMPGVRPDPPAVCQLIDQERVTFACGVPTIWVGVLDYLERSGASYDFSSLREVICGGSAVPVSLIRAYKEKLGVNLVQAYGMTEATPLVTYNWVKSNLENLPEDEKFELAGSQGLLVPLLEMKLVDDEGRELPWDGEQRGELLFRGPTIASEYYNDHRSEET